MTKPLPSWTTLNKHQVFANGCHDDVARMDFLTHLNAYLGANVLPGVKTAYQQQVLPAYIAEHGHEPRDRHEIRNAMLNNSYFQFWSALRRNTMEMRHQAGRAQVLGQIEALMAKVTHYTEHVDGLQLDGSVAIPDNIGLVDIHCQPGCYYQEYFPDDITVAASYDLGLFVTTAGLLGSLNDGGGQAICRYLSQQFPDFSPKKILDIGCTIGHNIVPIAQAFPDAEVIAVDVARPCLRYGHARAKALGVNNITFVQANAEDLSMFDDHSFDLITTAMFWHETSANAMPAIFKSIYRLLKPGGLTLHLEQPQYLGMDVYEQFIRDWDTYFNNEPYWGPMHDLDLQQVVSQAGFHGDDLFQAKMVSLVDEQIYGKREHGEQGEDYGRAPVWNGFGIWKQ
ncbi:class I SAM-dependent methyltransferase [Thalassotalea maritima]|uniref:class I SAM-dependent methyltransferase n=1 Tax=Thalassotalea maritima TaxID=3242416 RepID=UPI003529B2D0